MARLVTITPVPDSEKSYWIRNNRGGYKWCKDLDVVGENIESAIWPLIRVPLEKRKKIKITITVEE